jgi:hypothetical protein
VVQRLIAVVQLLKVHILADVVVTKLANLADGARDLLRQRLDAGRDQTTQVQSITLGHIHCHALVPQRIVQDANSVLLCLERLE